jgi:hypothetical protein
MIAVAERTCSCPPSWTPLNDTTAPTPLSQGPYCQWCGGLRAVTISPGRRDPEPPPAPMNRHERRAAAAKARRRA